MIQKTKKTIVSELTGSKINQCVLCTAFIIVFSLGNCFAQKTDKYGFNDLKTLFHEHEHETIRYTNTSEKPKNEMEFLLAAGFNFYKTFFSSQDNPSCIFHPSCSSYSVESFQQKGVIIGTLSTFDRLSRCHQLIKKNQYQYDPAKRRFYDPVN